MNVTMHEDHAEDHVENQVRRSYDKSSMSTHNDYFGEVVEKGFYPLAQAGLRL